MIVTHEAGRHGVEQAKSLSEREEEAKILHQPSRI
jgi:hypothetical protein